MKKASRFLILFILSWFSFSCENEPVDLKYDQSLLIQNDSEIMEALLRVAKFSNTTLGSVCIEFIYPFTILEVNDSSDVVAVHQIFGSNQLISLLENLPQNNGISISYPLVASLPEGGMFTISNNSELLIALDFCTHDDIVAYCSGLFSDANGNSCVWKIPYHSGFFDNKFAGAFFEANFDGSIKLHYQNETYIGTWVFLFINSELHLNIYLVGNSTVSQYWNVNFKADFSSVLITLNNGNNIKLIKSCGTTSSYSLGQEGPNGGIITYVKTDYNEGWKYLEIAAEDQIQEQWGCSNASVLLAQNSEIGDGLMNSVAIANYHEGINYASNPLLCSDDNNGTLTAKSALLSDFAPRNWHLPTIEELELLYNNTHLNGLGDFSDAIYWSSTEASASTVFGINFSDGTLVEIPKNSTIAKTRKCIYF
ncbi:DUF1566 domain-containing protein [Flavobacterium orientale]|uniref:DUF1566 domain-containing protein n=1 Tax=Flavobacterium orientale TaxID=1756020 RepID=A0A917DG75_9FLAO|nr:DUF1566 domain-containing protein [Flavobacterium orientale]GGD33210.1 hypothetical protein GCM10011343_24060 [Flavobacterium orientale]